MGTGPLHVPKLPGVPGIDDFEGHAFHTSRWDYAYTGGDPTGAPMTGLADKRVAVIGTGATAVQCVPRLAREAGERSEEHTSELQSLMRISYAVFCLKKKNRQ